MLGLGLGLGVGLGLDERVTPGAVVVREAVPADAEAIGVVGFLHVGPTRDAPDDGRGEVYSLNVHPAAWGTGAAGALLRAACETLAGQGHGVVHLWTFHDAPQARRFYEKSGFECTGRSKLEGPAGGPPVTEIEYSKPLAPPPRTPA